MDRRSRRLLAVCASVFLLLGERAAIAGQCLAPFMSTSGQTIMSPYGLDRSGRPGASAGYHQGLDIVNSVGRGDPVKAGVSGRVLVSKDGSGGQKVIVETSDGTQRFGYFHLDRRSVRAGETVSAADQVGIQGSTGVSRSAVHVHLSALMSGEALRAAGGQSRVWYSPHGWTGSKSRQPLTAAEIAKAAPSSFYFVNPETFLPARLPFTDSVLSSSVYANQGFSRPGGLSLPPTCAPADLDQVGAVSSNGGISPADGETGAAAGKASDVGHAVDMATGEYRDAVLALTEIALAESAERDRSMKVQDYHSSLTAALMLMGLQ